jgi:protoporphyrin/coproporphyrin ferrochelatase
MSRLAVVLFNLGGPDSIAAVEPFLANLFADPAIVELPNPFRAVLAKLIAHRRGPTARAIYEKMGNASPLLANTEAQARALEPALGPDARVFIAMRYWAPLSEETAAAVKRWNPDEIVLLPLYPQYSSTTTGSSLTAWRAAAAKAGLAAPTRAICCYPSEPGFVAALRSRLERALAEWPAEVPLRILLSAHGLPKRIVARGDPYPWQIEATAAALCAALAARHEITICYQSRVGPLEWLAPATDAEIRRAGAEGKGLIVLPIAFVSEHSETLVELDIEYSHLAKTAGVPRYVRAPTVGTDPAFIAGLAALVGAARGTRRSPAPASGERLCPGGFARCPCAAVAP